MAQLKQKSVCTWATLKPIAFQQPLKYNNCRKNCKSIMKKIKVTKIFLYVIHQTLHILYCI